MALELDPKYNPRGIETRWYESYETHGAFRPEYGEALGVTDHKAKPFSIVIPPPNVTGSLHVGHALDQTIQDVLTRTARKLGRPTLWLPGMDHAGIATQSRVEKTLQEEEGLSRHDLGREQFIKRVWDWKEHYGGVILKQQRTMLFSLDWSRERFTMDEGLSRAVRKVFVDLYKEGLIYRDTRMINWDPVAHTVLSDLEVEHDEGVKGELYHFAYKLSDGSGEVIVATTRPETMLGDTAIAVHPEDPRHSSLIGQTVDHPFLNRKIPIVGDAELVDMEFGTGAVKITPAHDFNDFDVGKRHELESITIFDDSACVNQEGGPFAGLDRFEARKQIKEKLTEMGLERGSKEHTMSLGRSQRSGAIVEPMISTQWFVKTKPLAEVAIEAVEKEQIKFYPAQWANLYYSWMREIRDWCISRQLWWGHQIPAWHCANCGHTTVSTEDPDQCESCESDDISRDEDVLDTWFSSGLWPFSTMGWPEDAEDLRRFYPTSVLVTAYDIIFFWVARMIMLGLHFNKSEPFEKVYIHGLMRDDQGRKISKSLGNNVDPAEVIEEYGADAYRFFLMATLTEGKDSKYSESRLKGYQNFTNKIWNSSRFVLMNLPEGFQPIDSADFPGNLKLEAEDLWILERLNEASESMKRTLEEFKFHIATEEVYSLVWNHFCDWYIELIKPRIFGKLGEESAESARQCVFFVLKGILGLVHPFMPAISEEIYSYLRTFESDVTGRSAGSEIDTSAMSSEKEESSVKASADTDGAPRTTIKGSKKSAKKASKTAKKKTGENVAKTKSADVRSSSEFRATSSALEPASLPRFLMWEPWPRGIQLKKKEKEQAALLSQIQEVIGAVRAIRADTGIAPDKKVKIVVSSESAALKKLIEAKQASICRLASAESVEAQKDYSAGKADAFEAFSEGSVYVPLEGLLDVEKELGRIGKDLEKQQKVAQGLEKKLNSSGFLDNAPPDVVEKEKAKLEEAGDRIQVLEAARKRLEALK
ncbi:MAG: valine--tRNA ligase [Leptospiraceae bacterium]|nr:valine--tRNA ligase [Leptospiraceae bacterium]